MNCWVECDFSSTPDTCNNPASYSHDVAFAKARVGVITSTLGYLCEECGFWLHLSH